MSSSKSRDIRRDKYSPAYEENFMTHRGQKVPLSGVAEMLRHCDRLWYFYLERKFNKTDEPDPLEQYQGADLRQALRDRGSIGLNEVQILAKSDEEVSRLMAGEPPYSDTELYGTSNVLTK